MPSRLSDSVPPAVARLRDGLVVSVQAPEGSALRDTVIITALTRAVIAGGARALRINGVDDVAAVRAITELPIIGLLKVPETTRPLITPTVEHAQQVVRAGADIVAVEATQELHGMGPGIVATLKRDHGLIVMADVSTREEGFRAHDAGADLVGTTLSGYTRESPARDDRPDLELITALADKGIRVVAEGRYRTREQIRAALDAGAWTVVVGSAITDPTSITRRLAEVFPRRTTP